MGPQPLIVPWHSDAPYRIFDKCITTNMWVTLKHRRIVRALCLRVGPTQLLMIISPLLVPLIPCSRAIVGKIATNYLRPWNGTDVPPMLYASRHCDAGSLPQSQDKNSPRGIISHILPALTYSPRKYLYPAILPIKCGPS